MSTVAFDPLSGGSIAAVVDRAGRSLALAAVLRGGCRWLASAGGLVIVLVWLDTVLRLPAALRLVLSIGAVGFIAGTLWAWVIRPAVRRQTPESIAFLLERRYGVRDNSLVGALQFERLNASLDADGVQRAFIGETARLGRGVISAVSVKDLFEPRMLLTWAAVAGLVAVAWMASLTLAPGWSGTAFKRFLLPLADVPPAAAVEVVVRLPDGDVVPQGADVRVEVELRGAAARRRYPDILWAERSWVDADDSKAVRATTEPVLGQDHVFTHTLRGVRQDVAIRGLAEGTYSRQSRVRVVPTPLIASSSFAITPPDYTGRATVPTAGPPQPLEALVGSRIALAVELDRPVAGLTWRIGDAEVACTGAGTTWQAEATLASAESYELTATIADIDMRTSVARGRVACRQDQAPDVRFVTDRFSHRLHLGDSLPVTVVACDDQGLLGLALSVRAAAGGSPTTVRRWDYPPPGRSDKVAESTAVIASPDLFAVGRAYVIELAGHDARPDAPPAVCKRPLLVEIVPRPTGEAAADPQLAGFLAALDRAIALQKQALEATRSFATNLPEVWLDLSRNQRPAAEVDVLLDQYRAAVLTPQRSVHESILTAAAATGAAPRAAKQLRELADTEAIAAGDGADALTVPAVAVQVDGEPAAVVDIDGGGRTTRAQFSPRQARWLAVVARHAAGWAERIQVPLLATHAFADGPPLDRVAWRVADVVPDAAANAVREALPARGQWIVTARPPWGVVIDLGADTDVAEVSLTNAGPLLHDVEFRVGTGAAPQLVRGERTETMVARQIRLLEPAQAALYAELVLLRGSALERHDDAAAREPDAPGVESAPLADAMEKEVLADVAEWKKDFERTAERRKALTERPAEDLSDADQEELALIGIEKHRQTRRIQRLSEDLTDSLAMDKGDTQRRTLRTRTVGKLADLADLAALAAQKAEKPETTWKLDAEAIKAANELAPDSGNPNASSDATRGKIESDEDKLDPSSMAQLAEIADVNLPELSKKWENFTAEADRSAPSPGMSSGTEAVAGGVRSHNSASGRPGDRTPDQQQRHTGRSIVGRTAQSDGQFVGDTAAQMPDDEVLAPDRDSGTALEGGKVVDDESSSEATSTGLGRMTNAMTEFGGSGKLPPDLLNKLQKVAGEATELSNDTNRLVLRLEVLNLPTDELRTAVRGVEQAAGEAARGNAKALRQAVDRAAQAFDRGRDAVAREVALVAAARQRDEARQVECRFDTRLPIPAAYDAWAAAYFKALAERAADGQSEPREQPR
ncbi:MAG: hypothetical protein NTW36_04725 [Planctomycetia bacterium]|nr:hypothetical protein [Planctomycetia bacterium]